ncbi:hypothetical protein [Sphingomonas sp. Leaf10]|uniref:hypothetical protein n=1 Tax=Sphingomonas sp. Leaf10 TaxID=1735676 RepID=UPI00138F1BEB|nr:hypothetical protein [Sphingomonas sp. Leaf10]
MDEIDAERIFRDRSDRAAKYLLPADVRGMLHRFFVPVGDTGRNMSETGSARLLSRAQIFQGRFQQANFFRRYSF